MQLMKKLFQFVAFALVLLAATQRLLADAACAQQRCGGTPDCSMHLDSLSIPDPAMQFQLASSQAAPQSVIAEAGCSYGSCWLRSDSAKFLITTPTKFKLAGSSTFLTPIAQFSASPGVILAARSSEYAAAGAVPKHPLFQVFRI